MSDTPEIEVPTRRLGRSGLTVSRLCLGTMMFGSRADEAEAGRIVASAAERGINMIDTADTYAGGRSEEIVGRLLEGRRDDWVLATKVANPNGAGLNRTGLSRKWLFEEVPACLKRLRTDNVDILYLHKEDPDTPIEETVRALGDLQRSGMIRHFGVSNFRAWRMAAFVAMCDAQGVARPIVCQPMYHALNRAAETEIIPAARHFGLGVVSYSPLARGVLTGKYRLGADAPPDSRAGRGDKRILQSEFRPEMLRAAERIAEHARARGQEPAAFALAWALANPNLTGLIAGPRTLDQWEGYLRALAVEITPEDERLIDELVPPGTSAERVADPAYPAEGRDPA